MLQGHPPYSLAYNMKLPGIYAIYALIMAIFGQTIGGIHTGLLIVNAASIVMVYLLGRRLFDQYAGAVAGVAYAIVTIHPFVLGTSAHATHFVVVFALAGIIVMLKALDSRRMPPLAAGGLLLGIAFLMKQPGLALILFGASLLAWTDLRLNRIPVTSALGRLGVFVLSAALPLALTCLALWRAGVFPRFWAWTYDYARSYGLASFEEVQKILPIQMPPILVPVALLWILALAGLTVFAWDGRARRSLWFTVSLLFFSLLGVSVGLHFRSHYFILAFPVLSLLVGLCVSSYTRLLADKGYHPVLRLVPTVLFVLSIGIPIYRERQFFFSLSPSMACRRMYGRNPFPEAVEIAKVLRRWTKPGDVIGVLGSEPELPFYARRRSASGYIYMYSLTEQHPDAPDMREEMIEQVTSARPEYIVVFLASDSWLCTLRPDLDILNWVQEFTAAEYESVGSVSRDPDDPLRSLYSWKDGPTRGEPVAEILKRID